MTLLDEPIAKEGDRVDRLRSSNGSNPFGQYITNCCFEIISIRCLDLHCDLEVEGVANAPRTGLLATFTYDVTIYSDECYFI